MRCSAFGLSFDAASDILKSRRNRVSRMFDGSTGKNSSRPPPFITRRSPKPGASMGRAGQHQSSSGLPKRLVMAGTIPVFSRR